MSTHACLHRLHYVQKARELSGCPSSAPLLVKSHDLDLEAWMRFNRRARLIFVSSERSDAKVHASVFVRPFATHHVLDYSLLVTDVQGEEAVCARVADAVGMQGRNERCAERLRAMNARERELREAPFEVVDTYYQLHGSHRNAPLGSRKFDFDVHRRREEAGQARLLAQETTDEPTHDNDRRGSGVIEGAAPRPRKGLNVDDVVVLKTNSDYRIADIVHRRGMRWEHSREQVMRRDDFAETALRAYLDETRDENTRGGGTAKGGGEANLVLLKHILCQKGGAKGYAAPHDREVVIYIRAGDVVVFQDAYLATPFVEKIRATVEAHDDIGTITVVTAFAYQPWSPHDPDTQALRKQNVFTYTEEKHRKNKVQIGALFSGIAAAFPLLRHQLLSHADVDATLHYLSSATHLIADRNFGFGQLAYELSTAQPSKCPLPTQTSTIPDGHRRLERVSIDARAVEVHREGASAMGE